MPEAPVASGLLDRLREPALKRRDMGTYRTCSPEETVDRLKPLFGHFGITRVADVTGLDRLGIPVMMVCRPNSRSVSVSQGKGLTAAAARASGVMEAIELHHAENIRLPLRYASAREMAESFEILNLDGLVRTASRQPCPHTPMLWIEGIDILSGKPVWVPYETVSLNTTTPATPGGECFLASSNGLASGNHPLEAIVHGLCEVVERDATTLWYLMPPDSQAARRIDAATVDDTDCLTVLGRFESAGMETMIWDLTSEIGIPVFMALITGQSGDPNEALYTSIGYGCHLSRGVSLLRALTEAAQSRLTLIAGSRDDIFREEYHPVALSSVESFRSLHPGSGGCRAYRDVPTCETGSFGEDLQAALSLLRVSGMEQVAVVDLTDDMTRIPVVRVIIPGLEGPMPGMEGPRMASGFTPGRRAARAMGGRP
jgi:YcaO-like protein with predicted kinase domain